MKVGILSARRISYLQPMNLAGFLPCQREA